MTADGQWLTFLALLLPFAAAAIAPVLTKALKHNAAWVLALAPALIFLHFTGFVGTISSGETLTGGYVWIPSLSVDFSWFLDGLSVTFALLITGAKGSRNAGGSRDPISFAYAAVPCSLLNRYWTVLSSSSGLGKIVYSGSTP